MSDRISVSIDKGVADVRLIRSDKMNALDDAMFTALIETGDALAANPDVRCVVISGEGRAFCAGLDMGNFGKMASGSSEGSSPAEGGGRLEKRTHGVSNRAQYAVRVWRELPVPVIAAVHGVAFGGGFQLTLGADMRYVAPDTQLSIMEIRWGLVPDMAGTQIMRHLAREDIVRELTYTGRRFSGEEAYEYGFATRVEADPLAAALETAREIASKSPSAIEASKRLLNAAVYAGEEEGLVLESVEQDVLISSPNQIEAVMSQMEKREANYAPARSGPVRKAG
ncbi:crotonase/enoyl-CoA hydratase family protein [Pyruvatibacter mobilis]|uniref:crotonase/enoyl-CoA hydratase family protein n=1 Tax=Pyruvatibacter mobilis TaxID=1712261 RepID=UPI003D0F9AF5